MEPENELTSDGLAGLQIDRKLLKRYADARRDEQETISGLVETLTKVDNLPEERLEQVRDALFHTDFPFLIALVGPFSAGKSSIINALLGEVVLDVGPVPTTDHIHILRHGPQTQKSRVGEVTTIFHANPLLEGLSFVDTPGLESVFGKHDQVTRRFLHRADLVFMVMVATQVMTASNLDFLRQLREYGKRVIVLVNQVDVLEEVDRATVREFVGEQAQLHLGMEPVIWMVSAKQALEAQSENPRDEVLYDISGFAEMEEYLQEQLNDGVRIRGKLETSLQIASNVRKDASKLVAENLAALTDQRKAVQNIEAQAAEAGKAGRRAADEGLVEIERLWGEATMRGSEAIRELFQFSRAFGQIFAGLGEIIGFAGLLRRFGGRTRAQAAFDKHDVARMLGKIPPAVDQLGARLEGRDLQDLDQLVSYSRAQIEALPPNLKGKVIGTVQAPMHYDRTFLRRRRAELDEILAEAGRFEIDRLDRQLRNMLVLLGFWELIVILITLVVTIGSFQTLATATWFLVFFSAILVALIGVMLLPIRGFLLERAYTNRMINAKDHYLKILREDVMEALSYGVRLRTETAAPFTRLVESQTQLAGQLKTELDNAEAAILRLQRGLAAL